MEPATAIEVSKLAAEEFRRDYLVASVVVLLVVNGAWAIAVRALVNAWGRAQEARVADQKEDRARYEALAQRLSVHIDRNTEAVTLQLAESQRRSKARRALDPPQEGSG